MIKRVVNNGLGRHSEFEVSGDILRLTNNCLNEVLHGFHSPSLPDVLGDSVEHAENLLDQIHRCAEPAGTLVLARSDLAVLARCIRRAVSELGPEFSTCTGFEVEEANSYEEEISRRIAEGTPE
jgi:hypothetical protein